MIDIGSALAILGAGLSIYGALRNNIWHDHHGAMVIWCYSNILLMAWATGYFLQWWDGGISAGALIVMYAIYTVSNVYGLVKK